MLESLKFEFKDFYKVCNILNTFTKMDVRLVDEVGNRVLQLVTHSFPAALQDNQGEFANIKEVLINNKFNSFYYYLNSYGLEYISTGIWKEKKYLGAVIIGPFLSNIPSIDYISDVIYKNKLPVSERNSIQEFYKSLVVISSKDSDNIGSLAVNLLSNEYMDAQLISSEQISSKVIKPIQNNEDIKLDIVENKSIIEFRYKQEKILINAIAKGDKEELKSISTDVGNFFNLPDRIPESPIRSSKNLLFVLNTLCRIAAEKGGVHPVYINNISEKLAIMIERAPNLPYLKKLSSTMINEYCDLVIMFSTLEYSSIVKKAVDYINLNLETELTLCEIAEELSVNSSHLSRKFKKDTGMTVVDYINRQRVEEAKLYLKSEDVSITEVAYMVGFNDLNYFGRVFKKITSMTPSQFVKNNY
jgi:two-component system response regulator YesN